jgi:N-methylhydantoinase A
VPGPAAYGKGGIAPTVTDANVVLGYLPEALLGGTFKLDREGARRAVQTIADALGIGLMEAARGIIEIVNENMFGALRMISVQQGYDPRHFALMGFGGAGPLHVNAIARLMGSWPAISPVSPGVLCALGDATTRMRTETARSFARLANQTRAEELTVLLKEMAARVAGELRSEGVADGAMETAFEIDVRYAGQAFEVPLPVTLPALERDGVRGILERFDAEHLRLFTFNMDTPHEIVNLRAVALGQALDVPAAELPRGTGDPGGAKMRDHTLWMNGRQQHAVIYDRARLRQGDTIPGPAIVIEMDATTLIETGCVATVDRVGNILIHPS